MNEIMFEGPRLGVDYESFLSQHDVVFEMPAVRQMDCLLLGNGDVGLQVDASGSQLFFGHIMKSDVWRPTLQPEFLENFTSLEKLNDIKEDPAKLKEITQTERKLTSESKNIDLGPRPLGNIIVTLESGSHSLRDTKELVNYRQKLSLYNALIETRYNWRNVSSEIVSFTHAEENIIIFHFKDLSNSDDIKRSVILHKKPIADFDTKPSFDADGNFFWLKYIFPDGFEYVMMALVEDVKYSTNVRENEVEAELNERKKGVFTVYVAIATNKDSPDPLKYARGKLADAQNKGYDELLNSHKSWWHDFWSKSFITISDEEAENCWYTGLYLMASCSRGKDMPNEFGPWAINEEQAAWGGRYWASEHPQMYWSVFSANHPELAEPYYRTYYNALPGARENAKVLYKRKGAIWGLVMDRGGIESVPFPYRFMYESGANVALIFWWGYLYTEDKKLLKEYAYPVIKDILIFYSDWLIKDRATGKIELPTPCCMTDEYVTSRVFEVKNATYVIALISRLFMAGIEAARILGVDDQEQKEWKEILSRLPELPSDGDVFLNYEGENPGTILLMPCPLGGVFPAKIVNFDDKRCCNTLKKMFSTKRMTPFGCSINWGWVSITASWLGKADFAVKALHNILSLIIFPNGWASNYENIEPVYNRNLGSEPAVVVPSQIVACINEMMLQSLYDGVIELFKGVTKSWNVRFANLRTVGAFLVSSEKINGEIPYISITSPFGKKCRIKVPTEWRGKILRISDVTSSRCIAEVSYEKIIEFDTASEHSYLIERKDAPFNRDKITIKARKIKGARRYLGLKKEDEAYFK